MTEHHTECVNDAGAVLSVPTNHPWQKGDSFGLALCIFCGLILSTIPHMVSLAKWHDPFWAADYDEVGCYDPVISDTYFNHPLSIGDPVYEEYRPGIYDRMHFVPFVLVARSLHLGPQRVPMLMRMFGGITIPLGFFLILRRRISKPWLLCAMCVFLTSDAGMITGAPFVRMLTQSFALLRGTAAPLLATYPQLQPQWRILNPAATLGWLLICLWLLIRMHEHPSVRRVCLAALGIAMIFYIQTFYWTALVAGLTLLIVFVPSRRRAYLTAGVIALPLAIPSLLTTFQLSTSAHPDWNLRSESLIHISRFTEILLPKELVLILLLSAWWIWKRAMTKSCG